MAERRNLDNDEYARDSFSMRTMAGWQLWGISIVVLALVAVLIYYLL